jgi:hypothetical protein
MFGPRVRTNFPAGDASASAADASSSSLSPELVAKLHRFNLASVQAAQQARGGKADASATRAVLPRAPAPAGNAGVGMAPSSTASADWSGGAFLEEQYVDQMIEELLDSDFSMEISY